MQVSPIHPTQARLNSAMGTASRILIRNQPDEVSFRFAAQQSASVAQPPLFDEVTQKVLNAKVAALQKALQAEEASIRLNDALTATRTAYVQMYKGWNGRKLKKAESKTGIHQSSTAEAVAKVLQAERRKLEGRFAMQRALVLPSSAEKALTKLQEMRLVVHHTEGRQRGYWITPLGAAVLYQQDKLNREDIQPETLDLLGKEIAQWPEYVEARAEEQRHRMAQQSEVAPAAQ